MNRTVAKVFTLLFTAAIVFTGCNKDMKSIETHTYKDRSYQTYNLHDQARGVLVFLHGASEAPFDDSDLLKELRSYVVENQLALIQPIGSTKCSALGLVSSATKTCWDLRDPSMDLRYIHRLIDSIEQQANTLFQTKHLLGYSNGGYLVGAGLQTSLLGEWSKVGIIAGGAVGTTPLTQTDGPQVFIEVGLDDRWQLEPSRTLYSHIHTLDPAPHYRETEFGHEVTRQRIREFLSWWDQTPLRAETPSHSSSTGVTP